MTQFLLNLVVAILCMCGSSVEVSPSNALAKEERSGKTLTEEEMMQIAMMDSLRDDLERLEDAIDLHLDQDKEEREALFHVEERGFEAIDETVDSRYLRSRTRSTASRILAIGALFAALVGAAHLPIDSLNFIKKDLAKNIATGAKAILAAPGALAAQLQALPLIAELVCFVYILKLLTQH